MHKKERIRLEMVIESVMFQDSQRVFCIFLQSRWFRFVTASLTLCFSLSDKGSVFAFDSFDEGPSSSSEAGPLTTVMLVSISCCISNRWTCPTHLCHYPLVYVLRWFPFLSIVGLYPSLVTKVDFTNSIFYVDFGLLSIIKRSTHNW